MLYGLMTEEINYSYDGGIYGELIRNRALRDNPANPDHWFLVKSPGDSSSMKLDTKHPVSEIAAGYDEWGLRRKKKMWFSLKMVSYSITTVQISVSKSTS